MKTAKQIELEIDALVKLIEARALRSYEKHIWSETRRDLMKQEPRLVPLFDALKEMFVHTYASGAVEGALTLMEIGADKIK